MSDRLTIPPDRLTAIEEEQRQQRKLLERVLIALTGDVTGSRQGVHERLNEHGAMLKDHDERLDEIEADKSARHSKLSDRVWQIASMPIGALFGALAGAAAAHWKWQ